MSTFEDLVASRKAWLDDVLRPWCRQARRADLLKAEAEWNDIAGRVDADRTLWLWAWSRFPVLFHEGLGGLEESWEVSLTLHDGRVLTGYPDNRRSARGQLMLASNHAAAGPFSIDDIAEIRRTDV